MVASKPPSTPETHASGNQPSPGGEASTGLNSNSATSAAGSSSDADGQANGFHRPGPPETPRANSSSSQSMHGPKPDQLGLLFHESFYRSVQGEEAKIDNALEHFLEEGWQDGNSPHPLFSVPYYLSQDVELEGLDPVSHFRNRGWKQGLNPHPFFDTAYYLKQIGASLSEGSDPVSHYLQQGWRKSIATHPWVWLDYMKWQLPLRRAGSEAPLFLMLLEGARKNNRPHPMYNPPRLSAHLRQQDLTVSREAIARTFVEWPNLNNLSPSPLLDLGFYIEQYPESQDYEGGAFRHFMEVGAHGDFDPNPYFCSKTYRERYGRQLKGLSPFRHYMIHEMSCRFDPSSAISTTHYSSRAPSLRRSNVSLLEHFLDTGRFRSLETRPFSIPRFVKKQLKDAARIDPEVKLKKKLHKLPVYNRHQAVAVAEHFNQASGYIGAGFKALVCVPYLARGGADLAATNLVRWLHEKYGSQNVLVVLTDADRRASVDWLPEATRLVSFSSIDPKLKRPDREQLLQALIVEYRPEAVYNVNSNTAWGLFSKKSKALKQLTRLYAHLFCFDFDQYHRPIGYAISNLPMAIQDLTSVYLDNDAFRQVLRTAFNFPKRDKEKLRVLYQPLKEQGFQVNREQLLSRLSKSNERRKNVFWAGRLDPQKRPDILLEIAKKCPQQNFHVYGTSVLGSSPFEEDQIPDNMTLYGEYREFFELPLREADLFLYTSAWDGLPLILIDIQQSGIPVIAPDVGGITELVNEQTGIVISDYEDVDAYAKAIQRVCSGEVDCDSLLTAAREKVIAQHHWSCYSKTLTEGLAPAGGQPGPTIP